MGKLKKGCSLILFTVFLFGTKDVRADQINTLTPSTSFQMRFTYHNRAKTSLPDRVGDQIALAYYLSNSAAYHSFCSDRHGGNVNSAGFFECYRTPNPEVDQWFQQLLGTSNSLLPYLHNAGYDDFTESHVRVMRAFETAISFNDGKSLYQWSRRSTQELSNAEFVLLVQALGSQLADGYDHKRQDAFIPGGSTSAGDMLRAAKHNVGLRRAQGDKNIDHLQPEYAGVCRDIVSLQAQMLEARGFKHTYIISGHTLDGWHTVVLSRDPQDESLYYQFNYGRLSTRVGGDGPQLSFFQRRDSSFNYRIYRPHGRQVANMPSDLGKLVVEALGFNPATMDPLTDKTSQLIEGKHDFNQKSALRVVAAQDLLGNTYTGSTFHYAYRDDKKSQGAFGVGIIYQYRPYDVYGIQNWDKGKMHDADQHAFFLAMMWKQEWEVLSFAIVRNLAAKFRVGGQILAAGSVAIEKGNDETLLSGQGDIRTFAEAKAIYQTSNGKFYSALAARVSVSPGLATVTDLHSIGLAVDYIELTSESVLNFDQSHLGLVGKIVVSSLDERAYLAGEWGNSDFTVKAGWKGSLQADSPRLYEGSLSTVFLDIGARLYACQANVGVGFRTESMERHDPLTATSQVKCDF